MALFTVENAREMGLKANRVRWSREKEMRGESGDDAGIPIAPDFADKTLGRVRVQMERLSDEIDKAIRGDSKRLKELTDAYSRLAEQERILAGRPLPGSRRPATERSQRRQFAPAPQPVVSPPGPVNDNSPARPLDSSQEPNG